MATSGLEKLGVAGGEDLRETLTNCTDPLKAIEQFQLENGVLLPSLQSALPFLDLHAIPRLDFHQSVFDELRDKLLERVAVIATEGPPLSRNTKLEELLEKSFALVRMPSVQPVVMCLLKHIPKVPERYLKQVTSDPALYAACATEVKRQIWQENQALFGDEASPLFKQYLAERETALLGPELSAVHTFYSSSPKARRHGQVVQKLTGMIGRNVKLYDMVLQFLRTLFLRTRNPHYCTLRAELLMALHDLEATDICSVDPCHKFTWCLDACIRERFVDVKRARELQGFLDGIKRGQEQVLGDLSMILCDPFAINTLAMSTMKTLQELVSHESLPRDSPDLQLLLRMLALGLGAWDMIDSQAFREPKLDVEVATRFLPALMTLLVDDLTFGVDARLPAEGGTPPTYPSGLPPAFTKWVQEHPVACEMGLYYVLHVTRQRNKNAIARVLPALAEFHRDAGYSDWFLHLFLSQLTLLADELGSEGLCGALFDSFLLPALSRENVHRHTLRLVLHVHAKLLPARLTTLRTALQPNKQSGDVVKELHTAFLAKGDSRLPGTAATAATAPVSATGVALTPGLTPVLALTQPVTISTATTAATTAATATATSVGTATGTVAGTVAATAAGTVPGTSAGTVPGTAAGTAAGTVAGTVAGGGASAGGAGGGESPRVSVAATVTPPP